MSAKQSDKLVMMANQIAKNFAIRGEEKAIEGTARHITLFWEPRMRDGIRDHVKAGGAGMLPIALKAVNGLAATAPAAVNPLATTVKPAQQKDGNAPKPAKLASKKSTKA